MNKVFKDLKKTKFLLEKSKDENSNLTMKSQKLENQKTESLNEINKLKQVVENYKRIEEIILKSLILNPITSGSSTALGIFSDIIKNKNQNKKKENIEKDHDN
ncbi:hypothetical protein M0813_29687 [Anaeramoeba flamelloides]|nr:hypothetical protein M0813_29687 [Anaeramoeba flamelloides]